MKSDRDVHKDRRIDTLVEKITSLQQALEAQKRIISQTTTNNLDREDTDAHMLSSYIGDSGIGIPGFPSQSKQSLWRNINKLADNVRKRILVTGGAGFVGSHLVDSLMLAGHEVCVVDNFHTGRKANIIHWIGHPNFEIVHHDIINPLFLEIDEIYNLASPASPKHYMSNQLKTIKTNTIGTINMLVLAKRVGAKILIASSSEIYGDPNVHPQIESYWGNVNTMGPRSCYDEGKRIAETLAYAYHKQENLDVRIARIFNTYGPRMQVNDGRVVSNFIHQTLNNQSMTVNGDGFQTRSFQYVSDLVNGLLALMQSNVTDAINIGNPDEHSVLELARQVKSLIPESTSQISHFKELVDDPRQRRPDIKKAKELLNWSPSVNLTDGLVRTIDYFREQIRYGPSRMLD